MDKKVAMIKKVAEAIINHEMIDETVFVTGYNCKIPLTKFHVSLLTKLQPQFLSFLIYILYIYSRLSIKLVVVPQ